MERLIVTIKKPYAREVLNDLVKMDAVEIKKENSIDPSTLIGTWSKRSKEEIDAAIEEMRKEWERDFS